MSFKISRSNLYEIRRKSLKYRISLMKWLALGQQENMRRALMKLVAKIIHLSENDDELMLSVHCIVAV